MQPVHARPTNVRLPLKVCLAMTSSRPWVSRALPALLSALLVACGGGGGSDGPSSPPPPDNSVSRIEIAPAGSISLASGNAATVTATGYTRDNRSLALSNVTWASSNNAVASVSGGIITARLVGSTTITASSAGITSSAVSVTVTAGSASRLVVRTQPDGASSGVPFSTQPVVEVRDAEGNLVSNANTTVTVAVASGGGTISGSTTATTVQGVAQFSTLALSGTIGAKSLSFAATGLTAVTSSSFVLRPGPAATVAVASATLSLRSGLVATTPLVAQLRDRDGNDVPLAGRGLSITVQGGTGVTAVSGASSTTDVQGRAAFPSLTITGLVGPRSLTISAEGIPGTAAVAVTLLGGRPTQIRVDRDLPAAATIGVPFAPQPIVQLLDSVGNPAPQARVDISAVLATGTGSLSGITASSDSAGRVAYTSLTFSGGTSGARRVQFTGSGLAPGLSRSVDVVLDLSRISTVSTSRTTADTLERMFYLRGPLDTLTPVIRTRNGNGQLISGAVRWTVRDPTRLTVDGTTGRLTALRGGRTFVVVQAVSDTTIADSLLVFVPQNASGPLLRTDLKSYRLDDYFRDTVSFSIVLESRDTRRFAGANLTLVLPASTNPFAPLARPLSWSTPAGVQFVFSFGEFFENRGVLIWTPSVSNTSAIVSLLTIQGRKRSGGSEQITLLLSQLLDSNYADLTSATSIFNPILTAR